MFYTVILHDDPWTVMHSELSPNPNGAIDGHSPVPLYQHPSSILNRGGAGTIPSAPVSPPPDPPPESGARAPNDNTKTTP